MAPSKVEAILFKEPFVPLRITVADGDQTIVNNPRRTLLTRSSLYYGMADDPASRRGSRLKIISVPNIVSIEPANAHPPRNGRRRRK